jgi:uncharacterized repeat protein (TIGR03843 family)
MLEGGLRTRVEKAAKQVVEAAQEAQKIGSPETDSPEERILSSRELVDSQELGGGMNETRFINLKDDGAAVFKPMKGESPLLDEIETGTYYKRERAAYLVDKFFGFGLVPPTVIRQFEKDIGSVQQFIPGTTMAADAWDPSQRPRAEDPEAESKRNQIATLALYDYLIFNADRHYGNALVKDTKLYAIDHGLAFGDSYYRNEALLEGGYKGWLCGERIPEEVHGKLKNFFKWEEGGRVLHDLLGELLSEKEVDAFFKRLVKVATMVDKGSFPYCW